MDVLVDVAGHAQALAREDVQDVALAVLEDVLVAVEADVQVDAPVVVEQVVLGVAPEDVLLDALLHVMETAQLTVLTVVQVNGHEAISSSESE